MLLKLKDRLKHPPFPTTYKNKLIVGSQLQESNSRKKES